MKEENYDKEEDELDFYSDEKKEESVEDDEIDELEEGFMQGYDGGERLAKCALCKKVLTDEFVEEEINGEVYRFCSEEHADVYKHKIEEE